MDLLLILTHTCFFAVLLEFVSPSPIVAVGGGAFVILSAGAGTMGGSDADWISSVLESILSIGRGRDVSCNDLGWMWLAGSGGIGIGFFWGQLVVSDRLSLIDDR